MNKGTKQDFEAANFSDGYRLTELGPLPEEWRVVRLGEVARTTSGGTPKRDNPDYYGGHIPWIKSGELEDKHVYAASECITEAGLQHSNAKIFEPGTLLMAMYGATAGKVGILQIAAATNQAICAIVPKVPRSLYEQFLFYALIHLRDELLAQRYGGAQPNLSQTVIQNLHLPLPPLAEQRAIAYVLGVVQRSRETTERVIAATRELKKSLMRHLFTYGPVPVGATHASPLQDADIGHIPAHWRVVRLGEVVILRSRAVSPSETPQARYVGLEHLDSGEIRIKRHGYASETKSAKFVFNPGNILYGKLRPYLDKSALAEWSGVCSTDILVLTPTKQVDPVFTAYLMHSSFVLQHAIATTSGVNHPRTSWKALSQAHIPLPPLAEQREIARILQAVDRKLEADEARRQALYDLFRSLLHDLMTARRRLPADYVAQFATRSHGLASQPTDATHGG